MTPTRESLGMICFKRSSCLPLISGARAASPVMFPPGRARLATNPLPIGSVSVAMTIGIVEVASFTPRVTDGPTRDDEVYLETDQFGGNLATSFEFSFRRAPFNDDVLTFNVSEIA